MEIEYLGAAQTVTGSKHVIRTSQATVLLDCGLVQGHRRESNELNQRLGIDPRDIDAVVLSHAHMDHSGALPVLVKNGYDGPIYATPATRDLCAAMLLDSALIQAADARYINGAIERHGAKMAPVVPIYTEAEAVDALRCFIGIPYHRRQRIAPGMHLEFFDAGHVLGSALVVLDIDDEGARKRVLFTGDLGRKHMPILRDPEIPSGVDLLITESTYGDRMHPPIDEMDEALAAVIGRTVARRGKVIIPSFALERSQELIYTLKRLRGQGRIPSVPVYVDSPLTVKVTDVFKLHPECFDAEALGMLQGEDSPFDFEGLHYVSDKEGSKAIDASPDPCVILSASGMCEGGRVLHHLRSAVESERNTIVIAGFQAQHTLGRRIAERCPRVRIFGVERDLRAEVVVLDGFSAHADQRELVDFAEAVRARGPLREIALVHGELPAQRALASVFDQRRFPGVRIPAPRDRVTF